MNIQLLKQVPLFYGIAELEKLVNCLKPEVLSYSKNELIYSVGDIVTHVSVILSGSVRIIMEDYAENTDIADILKPGEIFGDICGGNKKSETTARAAERSQIMTIEYNKITDICQSACKYHTQAMSNLVRMLAIKNRELYEKLQILQKHTTREKLIAYLYVHAKKANNSKFNIPLNRAGLSEYLCVDRSAMSRELCKMRDEGLLEFYKSSFILMNIDK